MYAHKKDTWDAAGSADHLGRLETLVDTKEGSEVSALFDGEKDKQAGSCCWP